MRSVVSQTIPRGSELRGLLGLAEVRRERDANGRLLPHGLDDLEIDGLLDGALSQLVTELLDRPSKGLRRHIVHSGFAIAERFARAAGIEREAPDSSIIDRCCDILEIFHAGSLIVDDIEDNSQTRRGRAALHNLYGVPLALNAGNWLYFLPFKIIADMGLSLSARAALSAECQSTLLRAHYGQALDLGVAVKTLKQDRIAAVTACAMELKSGVLMGLALKMGAVVLECSPEVIAKLDRAGRDLGVCLQMFDDIGNLVSPADPAKRFEDLRLKRPSFVVATAAANLAPQDFTWLMSARVETTEEMDRIARFLADHRIPQIGRAKAEAELDRLLQELWQTLELTPTERLSIETVCEVLRTAYE